MSETQAVVVRQGFSLPEETQFRSDLKSIAKFQAIVQQELIKGMDYGEIPGTKKNTLLKPGAEKIAKLLGLSDRYEVIEKIEDWGKPLFYYQIRCILTHEASGMLVSEGLGSCNSMEDKYRYRWMWPNEVPPGMDKSKMVFRKLKTGALQYRIDNEEIYTIVNTILKMAKKRALVDASLSAGRLSNVFTQDLEDYAHDVESDDTDQQEAPEKAPAKEDYGTCPECGKALRKQTGKFGDFISCSGYPQCKYKPPKKGKEKPAPADDSQPTDKPPVEASEQPKSTKSEGEPDYATMTQRDYFECLDKIILDKELTGAKVREILKPFGYTKRTEITIAKRGEILKALQEG